MCTTQIRPIDGPARAPLPPTEPDGEDISTMQGENWEASWNSDT